MDPASFFGVGTWALDKVAGSMLGRRRLRLTVRSEEMGPAFIYVGGPVETRPRDVVIRAANTGSKSIEVEHVGFELSDGASLFTEDWGAPTIVTAPGHVERYFYRKTLLGEMGDRQLRRIVAVGTDGTRYSGEVPKEWRDRETWPK